MNPWMGYSCLSIRLLGHHISRNINLKTRRRSRSRWLCLLLCTITFGDVYGHEWTALYAFGDSFTDSGAGYVDGNGPTSVVYLAQILGIPFTYAGDPNAGGKGLNFAVSGAQTGKSDGTRMRPATAPCGIKEALLGRGMQTQVFDFVNSIQTGRIKFDPKTTLFFIAGGLNDSNLPTAATVSNLETEVRDIYKAGGRNFLVAIIPKKIPQFSTIGVRLDPAIEKIPLELRPSLRGAHIEISRWGDYFDQILERPAVHGITNTTDRCAGRELFGEDPAMCSAPRTYFFYHEGHPSTVVQRIVASQLSREVAELFP